MSLQVPHLKQDQRSEPAISVLIPARNEASVIRKTIESVRSSLHVNIEIIICDDHSTDGMDKIIQDYCKLDSRIRLIQSKPLPNGWAGKQYACWQLAQASTHPILTFIDADVQLKEDGLARMANFLNDSQSVLVSGIPRQETKTLLEVLLLPLIHWLLLCHLPMWWMRTSTHPRYGAGCGQWFMTYREEYFDVGGHQTVKESYHDGVQLPRQYRLKGYKTDLCDATPLADCRMYHNSKQVWQGLAKNAREGLASPTMIWFWTILFVCGYIIPLIVLVYGIAVTSWSLIGLVIVCYLIGVAPRMLAAWRFSQSCVSALLHPIGLLILLGIQWYAALRAWVNRPIEWKGRTQPCLPSK